MLAKVVSATSVTEQTHRPNRRIHAVPDDGVLQARLFALVASCITVADGRPGEIDPGTTTGEEEIVLRAEQVTSADLSR
jgi:hypothetical protein